MNDQNQGIESHQTEHLLAMLEISRILNSTLDLGHLLRIIVNSAVNLTDCEDSSIMLIDEKSGKLFFRTSARIRDYKLRAITIPMDSSIAGWVVRHNRPLVIDDAQNDPRFFKQVDKTSGLTTRSVLGVPLVFKERVIGVLEAVNKKQGRFGDQDTERLTILAAQAAIAIENARLVNELQRAYDELSELDRLKTEFITTTSHELRTPLTAIKGYLQLALSGMMPPEQQKSALNIIAHHVDTIIHLVNDLLFMQEMNAIEFKFTHTDMAVLINQEIARMNDRTGQMHIRLTSELVSPSLMVWGDAEHLGRMLHNLLDNAVKFSLDGGDVTVRLFQQDEQVCIQVADQGIGIPLDQLDKIFERFYRVEEPGGRLVGGLGLGLSIARHIAQAHGGQIDVVSAPGQGSTFTVRLPQHHSSD